MLNKKKVLFCYSQSVTSWRVWQAISTNIFELEWSSKDGDRVTLHCYTISIYFDVFFLCVTITTKCCYSYALTLCCGYRVLIEPIATEQQRTRTMDHNRNPLSSKTEFTNREALVGLNKVWRLFVFRASPGASLPRTWRDTTRYSTSSRPRCPCLTSRQKGIRKWWGARQGGDSVSVFFSFLRKSHQRVNYTAQWFGGGTIIQT